MREASLELESTLAPLQGPQQGCVQGMGGRVEGRGGVYFRSAEQQLWTSIWSGLGSREGPVGFVFFPF